ncbi:MAG: homoserine dehydrogenase [Rhodospirillaceae bacterium]|nr:homoserine dehydrogenase [Rhodospirillaceae bacterium]
MTDSLKVAVCGLGTVGAATLKIIQSFSTKLSQRSGKAIIVIAVSAKNRHKERDINLSNYKWFDDPVEMATDAGADVIVELIGGARGVALDVARATFKSGKHLITANKAMVAESGPELLSLAESSGSTFAYEATVAGGIPIVKALREGLVGNAISNIQGLLNGTCNYILSTMETSGRCFDDVLAEAQKLGYAESDPSFDIDGIDAAHKLAILASLAFNTQINFKAVHTEGIREVLPIDFKYAAELGFKIKLVGTAGIQEGKLYQWVHPCLLNKKNPMASVDGAYNSVVIEGSAVGTSILTGKGAGAEPTASAVIADIVDVATNRMNFTFGVPLSNLSAIKPIPIEQYLGAFYVRFEVQDKPGVFAKISAIFGQHNISMESILQRDHETNGNTHVVIVTDEIGEVFIRAALSNIMTNVNIIGCPSVIRIEKAL